MPPGNANIESLSTNNQVKRSLLLRCEIPIFGQQTDSRTAWRHNVYVHSPGWFCHTMLQPQTLPIICWENAEPQVCSISGIKIMSVKFSHSLKLDRKRIVLFHDVEDILGICFVHQTTTHVLTSLFFNERICLFHQLLDRHSLNFSLTMNLKSSSHCCK